MKRLVHLLITVPGKVSNSDRSRVEQEIKAHVQAELASSFQQLDITTDVFVKEAQTPSILVTYGPSDLDIQDPMRVFVSSAARLRTAEAKERFGLI